MTWIIAIPQPWRSTLICPRIRLQRSDPITVQPDNSWRGEPAAGLEIACETLNVRAARPEQTPSPATR